MQVNKYLYLKVGKYLYSLLIGGQVALVLVPLRVHLGPRGLPGLLWRWQEGGEGDLHHLHRLHCHHN